MKTHAWGTLMAVFLTTDRSQHFRYGLGAFRFRAVSACRGPERIKSEPLSFYLNLLRYPLSQVRGWRAPSVAGLLVVLQAANAAGVSSGRERIESRMSEIGASRT